jgi:hypothetical protein
MEKTTLGDYTWAIKKNLHFFFKSVGKHLKSVGGRRLKKSVELACMQSTPDS